VLGQGGPADKESHRQRRLEVLRLWRSGLVSGGRLVVADVPAAGVKSGWVLGAPDGLVGAAQMGPRDDHQGAQVCSGAFARVLECSRLNDYIAQATQLARQLDLQRGEPATFFDRIVSTLSPYGHVACFNSPQEVADLFWDAGFENVKAFVAPTPWLFPAKADALWFVHELLGLGQPCGSVAELPVHEQDVLAEGIADHLALRQVTGRCWAISWKLMYVVGDNP
jgi:hypothetical protein